jgi:predicted phospho-2-dehydro-3-deoxyheptonate aldolase
MFSKKQQMLQRIVKTSKGKERTVILPMDHGISDGLMPGLIEMKTAIANAKKGGVDAIVIHKGIYKKYKSVIGELPVLIHISASTGMGEVLRKVLITTPKEVEKLGAQGVSIHVNLANKFESEMIKDFGQVAGECERLGLPLLAMVYPRDEVNGEIVTYNDPKRVAHAARLAFEIGADIVKVPYTGSAESFKEVVEGCDIPVVIAGGAKGSEDEMLGSISDCVTCGAAGVSVGRNVFQAKDPVLMMKKVKRAVYEK